MNSWYEKAKYRYPKGYMTLAQLDRVLQYGFITQEEYDEIVNLQNHNKH